MQPFSTPWKHNVRFSDVFRGWRKGALGKNGLKIKKFQRNIGFNLGIFLAYPVASDPSSWKSVIKPMMQPWVTKIVAILFHLDKYYQDNTTQKYSKALSKYFWQISS